MKVIPKKASQKDLELIASIKNSPSLGKHGIKGNTGLGVEGFFHLSAPYDSNGMVFVQYTYRRKYIQDGTVLIEEMDSWKRMTLARAKKEHRRIIPCSMCNKPAVSLDHLWPYEIVFNRCAEHYKSKP